MFLFGKRKKKTNQDSNDKDALLNNEASDNAQDLTETSKNTDQAASQALSDSALLTEQANKLNNASSNSAKHAKSLPTQQADHANNTQNNQEAIKPHLNPLEADSTLSEQPKATKKVGLFSRLKRGLSKTGSAITEGMGAL
ncbi:MAG TPA: hypothetical protein ENK78_00590, partial [Thiothrix sp.]|nr:hypothetical protein [Thiothrix sp.]